MRLLVFFTLLSILSWTSNAQEVQPDLVDFVHSNLTNLDSLVNKRFNCYLYSDSEDRDLCDSKRRGPKSKYIAEVLNNERAKVIENETYENLSCLPKDQKKPSSLKMPYLGFQKILKAQLEACEKDLKAGEEVKLAGNEDEENEPAFKPVTLDDLKRNLASEDIKKNVLFPYEEHVGSYNSEFDKFKSSLLEMDTQLMTRDDISPRNAFRVQQKMDALKELRLEIIKNDEKLFKMTIKDHLGGYALGLPEKTTAEELKSLLRKEFKEIPASLNSFINKEAELAIHMRDVFHKLPELIDPSPQEVKTEMLKALEKVEVAPQIREELKKRIEVPVDDVYAEKSKTIEDALKANQRKVFNAQKDLLTTFNSTIPPEVTEDKKDRGGMPFENPKECLSFEPICEEQKDRLIFQYSNIIFSSEFYGKKDRRDFLKKIFSESKGMMESRLKESKLSSGSREAMLESLGKVKLDLPDVSADKLNSYLEKLTSGENKSLEDLQAAEQELRVDDNFKDLNMKELSSMAEANAFYLPNKHSIRFNCPFASKNMQENHNLKSYQIMLHEIGHALDPEGMNGAHMSTESKALNDNLQKCIDDKFSAKNKRSENFADLIANEALLSFLQKNPAESEEDKDKLNDFLRDSLNNSCDTKSGTFELHQNSYVREQQMFSHPLFEKAVPDLKTNISHGPDCGGILWSRER